MLIILGGCTMDLVRPKCRGEIHTPHITDTEVIKFEIKFF